MHIRDLNLCEELPEELDFGGAGGLVVLWRAGCPLGTLPIGPGHALRGAALHRALLPVGEATTACQTPPAGPAPSLSVVVLCTRGRPALLREALTALRRQTRAPDEVLVIDNAPTNAETRALVRSEFPDCRYVGEPRPGMACARNRGWWEAHGEVIAFLDDDCQATPDWVAALLVAWAHEPSLGACTGPLLPLELRTRAQQLIAARDGFSRGFHRQVFTHEPDGRPGWPLQVWRVGTGANLSFRRDALPGPAPFDERLANGEELDALFRVLRAGHGLLYEPQIVVRQRPVTEYPAARQRLRNQARGYLAVLGKIIRQDTAYRGRALREMVAWLFDYQMRRRIGPRLLGRGRDFPLELMGVEVFGGLAGAFAGLRLGAAAPTRAPAVQRASAATAERPPQAPPD